MIYADSPLENVDLGHKTYFGIKELKFYVYSFQKIKVEKVDTT